MSEGGLTNYITRESRDLNLQLITNKTLGSRIGAAEPAEQSYSDSACHKQINTGLVQETDRVYRSLEINPFTNNSPDEDVNSVCGGPTEQSHNGTLLPLHPVT